MDPKIGHLIKLEPGDELPPGYIEIPPELHHAVAVKLCEEREGYVSLASGGKLSQFARD